MQYLSDLRSVWAEAVLQGACDQRATSLVHHPLRNTHPLTEALALLLAKKMGISSPPLKSLSGTLPLGDLCQLAILRELLGEDGYTLGNQLLKVTSFPSLWCSEKNYSLKESLSSIHLLRSAFNKEQKKVEEESRYFQALQRVLPQLEEKASSLEICSIQTQNGFTAAYINEGKGVPLGAISSQNIAVPALGPQAYPLNNPWLLGVDRVIAHRDWAGVSAYPEIWMETSYTPDLEARFFGLKGETPLAFVFYVQAKKAELGSDVYLSKSLRRYKDKSQKVTFEREGSQFSIENRFSCKMELIPLAGDGSFWNADFLLAFEIPVHNPKVSFQMTACSSHLH